MKIKKFSVFVAIIIFLVFVCLGGRIFDPSRHILRYHPTGFNSHFDYPLTLPYSAYLQSSRLAIKNARQKAQVDNSEQVVLENAPTQSFPQSAVCKKDSQGKYQNGILLIHGFSDSPYSMHMMETYFNNKCFVVYRILLPGHGTVSGDLLEVTYQDWIKAVDYGTYQLSLKANNIYLGGFSLGGLLAINEALNKPSSITGLFLFAPALKIKFPFPRLITLASYLSYFIPALAWVSYHEDTALVRNESMPLHPISQIVLLINTVSEQLAKKPLTIPLFVMQSAQDSTVDPAGTLKFFEAHKNPLSRLFWFTETGSLGFASSDKRIRLINGHLPQEHILNMSHTSFTLSAVDPIYGRQGQYKDCLNYPEHSKNWNQCKSGRDTYLGERGSIQGKIIQRLSFNPFFDYTIQQINLFLAAINQAKFGSSLTP